MGLCWRFSPLMVVIVLLGHATSWFGLGTPDTSSATTALAGVGDMLSGASSIVSQIFAWLFVLFILQLLCNVFTFVLAEIKHRRLYDRPSLRSRWARPAAPSADPVVQQVAEPRRPL